MRARGSGDEDLGHHASAAPAADEGGRVVLKHHVTDLRCADDTHTEQLRRQRASQQGEKAHEAGSRRVSHAASK